MEQEDNYFTLLDMFTGIKDIVISILEFCIQTKQFFLDLWLEFYLQLTTISWLTVRNVQRTAKPLKTALVDETVDKGNLFSLLDNLPDIANVFSFGSNEDDKNVPLIVETEAVSKAEERVRLAEEIIVNNTNYQ